MQKHGEASVRGGPWCEARLQRRRKDEIDLVAELGSARRVCAEAREGTDLWKHLHDKPWKHSARAGGTAATSSWGKEGSQRKRKKPFGAEQRRNRGLTYGSHDYHEHKYRINADAVQERAQHRYNQTRPHGPGR